jgi:hypothetical protein
MFSGVFIVDEVDAVGDNGSGDTTTVDIKTILQDFLNMYLRSACFSHEALLW